MKKNVFSVFFCLIFLFCSTGFSAGASGPATKKNQSLLEDNVNLFNDLVIQKKQNLQLKNKLDTAYNENAKLNKSIEGLKETLTRIRCQESELKKSEAKAKVSFLAKKSAYYNLASIYLKKNLLDKAISEYRKVLEIDARDKDTHFNLGYLYTLKEDFTNAASEYEKVLSLDPDDKQAHYNLAIIYYDNLKNEDKAREHYEKFLQ